jgi:chromosome partitioning protein
MEGAASLEEKRGRPAIIVVGNEKGGTGKSTTAIHLAVALLHKGYRVATLDLDPRQKTLTRYIENRRQHAASSGRDLVMPHHSATDPLEGADASATVVARARLAVHLRARENFDYIILDTPGTASALSRAAHEIADILVTPMNDSLIDIDVLARIDWDRRVVLKPSVYSQFVSECRLRSTNAAQRPFRWIVLRNRVSHIQSRNKRDIDALMDLLAQNIGFQAVSGFGERVVYRELFSAGLTVLDAPESTEDGAAAPSSHRAARAEVSNLLAAINVEEHAAA